MAVDQGKAEEHLGFEFETERLGRVCCRPLDFKLLFRFTDLLKRTPDTVPDFISALLSVVGERCNAAVPEERAISWEEAKALTDQEMEEFAAKFLEAGNWIGPGVRAQPTSEGVGECSHGERLRRAFEAYEEALARQTKPYPLADGVSEVVPSDSDLRRSLIRVASIEAPKSAFWDSVKKSVSDLRIGSLEQWHRTVGAAPVKFKRLLAKIGEKWQGRDSRIAQHSGASRATVGALEQRLVNHEAPSRTLHKINERLERIRERLKQFWAEAHESVGKVVDRRVLPGVVIFAAIIGLLSAVYLYLNALVNSRSQELAAIGKLTDTVRSLSERMDAQTRELAELVKRHDFELRSAAQQKSSLDTAPQKAHAKRPHHQSSLRAQRRQARSTPPSAALRLSHR